MQVSPWVQASPVAVIALFFSDSLFSPNALLRRQCPGATAGIGEAGPKMLASPLFHEPTENHLPPADGETDIPDGLRPEHVTVNLKNALLSAPEMGKFKRKSLWRLKIDFWPTTQYNANVGICNTFPDPFKGEVIKTTGGECTVILTCSHDSRSVAMAIRTSRLRRAAQTN